jgi:site-specific DNA-methyltransferase (adenine-specific)
MITPNYTSLDGRIRFYNCDCMDLMNCGKKWDLAVVDPPYGINASKGTWGSSNKGKVTNYGKKDWDKQTPEQDYFFELRRVSKNQIVWGANHFISRMPFDSSCWLVWDKQNTGDFADCELAWCSFNTAVRKFVYRWNGMLQQNMKNKEERIHPTQKPIALYRWILKNYAKAGDTILDTHGGSMSSAIACHMEGFELDICELDKEYFDAAVNRFKIYEQQQKLF